MKRLVAAVLLALGLVLGVVLPVTGSGRLPLVLGAVCLAAAGVVAAWSTRTDWSRMAWVAAGVAAAVALVLVPGVVNGRRNAQGIAWTVPRGEHVILAEAGVAVTRRGPTGTLTGRELDSGAQRWRLQLGDPELNIGQLTAQRVGGMLILLDADGLLRGVDLATGNLRWQAAGGRAFPIASPAATPSRCCAASSPTAAGRRPARPRTARCAGTRRPRPPIGTWAPRTPRRALSRGRRASRCCAPGSVTRFATWRAAAS